MGSTGQVFILIAAIVIGGLAIGGGAFAALRYAGW
jgi:hypothetical protein